MGQAKLRESDCASEMLFIFYILFPNWESWFKRSLSEIAIDNIGFLNNVKSFCFAKYQFQVMLGAIPLVLPDIVPGLKQRKT